MGNGTPAAGSGERLVGRLVERAEAAAAAPLPVGNLRLHPFGRSARLRRVRRLLPGDTFSTLRPYLIRADRLVRADHEAALGRGNVEALDVSSFPAKSRSTYSPN